MHNVSQTRSAPNSIRGVDSVCSHALFFNHNPLLCVYIENKLIESNNLFVFLTKKY